jgi:hypothetical protein
MLAGFHTEHPRWRFLQGPILSTAGDAGLIRQTSPHSHPKHACYAVCGGDALTFTCSFSYSITACNKSVAGSYHIYF